MKIILKLLALFTRQEQKNLFILLLVIIVMAFFQVLAISSLAPLMSFATDQNYLSSQPYLLWVYNTFHFTSAHNFLIAIGFVVFFIIVISNVYTGITMYWLYRFVGNRRYKLSFRLFSKYLRKPYDFFLSQNTGELGKNILSEVDQLIVGLLQPGMEAVARGMVALAIIIFLFISNPLAALIVSVFFFLAYTIIFIFVRKKLNSLGIERRNANLGRFKSTAEAFGSIKDVKVLGKEFFFEQQFGKESKKFAGSNASHQILSQIPKYIIEALAFGLIVLFIVFILIFGGNLTKAIPLLTIYAFSGYKLLPALQIFFKSITQIRYNAPIVDQLYNDLIGSGQKVIDKKPEIKKEVEKKTKLDFSHEIILENIFFSYPSSEIPVLNKISLLIKKNEVVAFVGETGCGKTTLVDIILGLLRPTSGTIYVDTEKVSADNLISWQRNFGYVPQHIFLCDTSITRNIAFGVSRDDIDMKRVENAARISNLYDFIEKELPEKYDTIVGEKGIRLSGGQRQRVGIARALYNDPAILILDEATSALDSMTEDAVMDAIHNLSGEKTIILIAHRITTIQECNEIFVLNNGKIMESGTYSNLLKTSNFFRSLAKKV